MQPSLAEPATTVAPAALSGAGTGSSAHRGWLFAVRVAPPLVQASMAVLALFIVASVFAPVIAPHDPVRQELTQRLRPPAGFTGGSLSHLLGTDNLGRDVLARLLYGARISLAIGTVGLTIGLLLGGTLGLMAGFLRGLADEVVMFLVDAQLAIPFILVALTALALFGSRLPVLIGVVGLAGWESYARVVRGMVLSAREEPYVLAARAVGASPFHVMARHVLPNVVAPLIVLATLQLTTIIVLEASLSFLGIGVQPPTASWGAMLGEGRNYLNSAWWIGVFPGAAIMAVTIGVSVVGDWLRDVLDPTLRGR